LDYSDYLEIFFLEVVEMKKKMVSSGKLVCVFLLVCLVLSFHFFFYFCVKAGKIPQPAQRYRKIIFTAIQTIKESKENSNQHNALTASKIAITIQTLF